MSQETLNSAEKSEQTESSNTGSRLTKLFILGALGAIVVALLAVGGYGYAAAKKGSDSPLALKTAAVLGMPVATVNGDKILYTDYQKDIDTLKRFYANAGSGQPQPSDEELSQQVLSRQMANVIIEHVASDLGVTVKDEDLATAKAQLISQFPSEEEAKKELGEKYSWTIEDYLKKVVRPILLEQAASEAFRASDKEEYAQYASGEEVRASHILFQVEDEATRKDVKKLAEEVLAKIKGGADFAELAKQYGSDGTKELGGDLGWFGKGVMVPAFETAVFALKNDQLSDKLVETEFGYHIIKKTGERKAKDFNKFLTDQFKKADVQVYMNVKNPIDTIVGQGESAAPEQK